MSKPVGLRESVSSPAHIRRIKMAVANKLLGPEYGCPVALMRLQGELTDREYDACVYYRTLRADYVRAIDAKELKAQSLGEQRSAPPDPHSAKGVAQAKREATISTDWLYVSRVVRSQGDRLKAVFELVVLDDKDPPGYLAKTEVARVARAIHTATTQTRRRAK